MPPAGDDDLDRHPRLPLSSNDWYDGGGEMAGSGTAPLSGPTAFVGDAGETAVVVAPLLGVPGADSHRNGTAPARRL
jgi:hypothetical protein